jgi:hypothetical protein
MELANCSNALPARSPSGVCSKILKSVRSLISAMVGHFRLPNGRSSLVLHGRLITLTIRFETRLRSFLLLLYIYSLFHLSPVFHKTFCSQVRTGLRARFASDFIESIEVEESQLR